MSTPGDEGAAPTLFGRVTFGCRPQAERRDGAQVGLVKLVLRNERAANAALRMAEPGLPSQLHSAS